MSDYSIDPQTIVDFWREAGKERWFGKDEAFDEEITRRFEDIYERAAAGELDGWIGEPTGALALVILLDQFPRNMFRGSRKMFSTDAQALAIAKVALERGDHHTVGEDINQFLAMPLMHSEALDDQEACVVWMEEIGPENLSFAVEHRDIVHRFGRFPTAMPSSGATRRTKRPDFSMGAGSRAERAVIRPLDRRAYESICFAGLSLRKRNLS